MSGRRRFRAKENREASGSEDSDFENSPIFKKKPKCNKKLSSDSIEINNDGSRINIHKKSYPACSFIKYYRNCELGLQCHKYKKPLKDSIINYCKAFQLYKIESPFDRRVTFILWHPTNPRVLSVAAHSGDILLYNYEQDFSSACLVKGIGPGGSVQSMKFDPQNPVQIYTASMEGKFLVLNFHTKKATQYLETNDINRWYVSLDVNTNNNVMVAGDTKGSVTILTINGEIIDTVQLHKKNYKVNHIEFSKRESWLLCTSSTDGSLKLWDIRNLKSGSEKLAQPLQNIIHERPINAAYFSLTNGCRLLTTDQKDKINIYRAPLWDLETVIHQPHRQFQHLTPIKAYWHPFEDIVFVGRYPHVEFPGYHKNEPRTIDFFDADTGDLLYQHSQIDVNGIMSLNRFNILGDALASSCGYRFMIWKPNFKYLENFSKKQLRSKKNGLLSGGRNGGNDDDDDDNDNDNDRGDDCDDNFKVDWNAIMKRQIKERREAKKKTKKTE